MVKSLVNSVAHKYAAATNPQAGNEDDALESRLLRVVMANAKQKVEEERRFAALAAGHLDDSPAAGHAESIAPIEKPPPARKENVIVHARVPLLEAPLLPKTRMRPCRNQVSEVAGLPGYLLQQQPLRLPCLWPETFQRS